MKNSVKSLLVTYTVLGFLGVLIKVFFKGIKCIFLGSSKMRTGWQEPIAVEICESLTNSEFRCHLVKEYLVIPDTVKEDGRTQKEDIYPLA